VLNALNAVVKLVGKLATVWNTPIYSMSAMDDELRDPTKYSTLVRLSTPSDRFATALLKFCRHNDVRSLFTEFLIRPPVRSNGRTYKMLVMFFSFFFNA